MDTIDKIPEIPPDDIMDYYLKSDKLKKLAVSGLLIGEEEHIKFLLGVLDVRLLKKIIKTGDPSQSSPVGYGLYKCEAEHIPILISNALGPFKGRKDAEAGCALAICTWIARGGEGLLGEIVRHTKEIIHGVQ